MPPDGDIKECNSEQPVKIKFAGKTPGDIQYGMMARQEQDATNKRRVEWKGFYEVTRDQCSPVEQVDLCEPVYEIASPLCPDRSGARMIIIIKHESADNEKEVHAFETGRHKDHMKKKDQ